MTDIKDWRRISELFDQLSELPEDAWEAPISSMNLEADAEKLLRRMLAASLTRDVLDQPVEKLAGDIHGVSATLHEMPAELLDREFGSWKVTQELGRGGMGAVLLAERADGQFEKTVALKVIRPGVYTDQTLQRFLSEMRILAPLEHPNIARLIDGGISSDGIPYFAMEFVEGRSITAYADDEKLSIDDRIGLVLQACEAVRHAHSRLIIHGDIKPSNILINADGQVRLVDFGIARSLLEEEQNAGLPRFTPRYASPEQAQGELMTTASDVFGLCAVLYELCCGSSPREEMSTTTRAEFHKILNNQTPEALDQFDRSADTDGIAGTRGTSGSRLRRTLRGDLGWILKTGLEVNPDRRFATVDALLDDLRRFGEGRAVQAHPPSTHYRVGRFVQRYKLPIVAAAAVAAALVTGAAVALTQAQVASREAENANWTSRFLLHIFDQADPWLNQQQPISVNELAAGAAKKLLSGEDGSAPDIQEKAAVLLARVQSRLGNYDSTVDLIELQIFLLEKKDESDEQLADAYRRLGQAEANRDNWDAARRHFQTATELAPLGRVLLPISVLAAADRVEVLTHLNDIEPARILLDQLLSRLKEIEVLSDSDHLLSQVYESKSRVDQGLGNVGQAKEAAFVALAHAERSGGDNPVGVANRLRGLSDTYHDAGDSLSAAEIDRQVVDIFSKYLGADHPQTLDSRGRLAVSLSNLGLMQEALEVYAQILEGQRQRLGENSHYVAATLGNIGAAYLALGKTDEALDRYQEAQLVWEAQEIPLPVYQALNLASTGRALFRLNRLIEADEAFTQSLETLDQSLGREHPLYSRAEVYYAPVLLQLGRLAIASERLPFAYENIQETYGADSKHTALAALAWADLLARQGETEKARTLAEEAVEILDRPEYRQRHDYELEQARRLLSGLPQ